MKEEESYTAAYPALLSLATQRARRLLGTPAEAEEVAQETLLRAYVSWNDIADYCEPWVARVAINLALSRLRQRRWLPPKEWELPTGDSTVETRVDLSRAVALLPARQRQVVLLRHAADLPEREVAGLLGISTGAVKRHLHRALQNLRSPAMGLAGTYTSPVEPEEEQMVEQELEKWDTRWRRGVEPRGGWAPRPWDHRYVRTEDGSKDRVAVDELGNVILDADGDEVMSGPGFDYEAVKVERGLPEPEIPEIAIPAERLSAEVTQMLERARRWSEVFGHTWIGVEHFGLAMLEISTKAVELIGAKSPTLAAAVARFYDGPDADKRLHVVEERLTGGWSPPSVPNEVVAEINYSLATLIGRAVERAQSIGEPLATPQHVAEEMLAQHTPPSLVLWLLEQGG